MSLAELPQPSATRENAPAARREPKTWTAGLLIVVAFLAANLLRTINVPWVEEDNWYGAVYSQAAHNNLRAGLRATGGVPATLYFGPLPIPREEFYVHHPTLFPLLVTGAFAIFGEAEWVARLPPIVCSLASVVLLWWLMRSTVGARAATLSAAVFATLPMELHYGDLVDFEPCLVMWMLAALCCLRKWRLTARPRWAWLAAALCQIALWTDWPGYLFVLSLAGALLLEKKRTARVLALSLLALVGLSGLCFLLQIRYINPDAWSDLRLAVTMRLGNGVHTGSGADAASGPHFTFAEWCLTIARSLNADYLPVSLVLAVAGTVLVLRKKNSPGLRAVGWAALPMFIAGFLYVVILRNESFIHDFASFYLIAAIAMMAGVTLDAVLTAAAAAKNLATRLVVPSAVTLLLLALAIVGTQQAAAMRSPFYMLDGETPEPATLIPALGRSLQRAFPPDTTIIANVDPYGSSLTYYTQRTILNNMNAAGDWQTALAREPGPLGGLIWLAAPGAGQIIAALPADQITPLEVEGVRFALWHPK